MRLFSNKRRIVFTTLVVGFLVLATLSLSGATQAQTLDEGLVEIQEITEYSSQDLIVTIGKIIQVVLGFVGLIALILFIYAGIVWMTSAGDPQKIELAKKIMIAVAIGMLITMSAFAITTFVIKKIQEDILGGPGAGGCVFGNPHPNPETPIELCSYCNEAGNGYVCNPLADTPEGDSCGPICVAPDLFRLRAVYPRKDTTNIPTCSFVWTQFNMLVDEDTVDESTFEVTVDMEKVIVIVGGIEAPFDGRQRDGFACLDSRQCLSGSCVSAACSGNTVAGTFSVDDNEVSWTGENEFFKNTQYKVLITQNVLSTGDLPGLSLLSGEGEEKEWTFTTGSEGLPDPPTVVEVDPANGEVDVCLEASLDIEFSQEMDPRTLRRPGAITMDTAVPPALDDYTVDDFRGYTVSVDRDLKSASAYPRNLYNTNTGYTPRLDSTIIKDICGNPLDGNANTIIDIGPPDNPDDDYPNPTHPWSFTTGGVDRKACPPRIDSVTAEGYYDGGVITIQGKYLGNDGDVIFNRQVMGRNNCMGNCALNPLECKYPTNDCIEDAVGGDWTNTQITLNIPAAEGGDLSGQTNGAISGNVQVKRTIDFKAADNVRLSDKKYLEVKSPYIKSISPEEGAREQYVTIFGMNFGEEEGTVRWVSHVLSGDGVAAEFPPPPCPKTWTDTRIIVKVHPGLANANYYLQVETADYTGDGGEPPHFSNVELFTVTAGTPGPGICNVVPECSRIGEEDEDGVPIPVVITGDNFGFASGIVKFEEIEARVVGWGLREVQTIVPEGLDRGYHPLVAVDSTGNPGNLWDFRIPCPLGESCDPNPITAACEAGGVCSGDQICGPGCVCADAPGIVEQQLCPIPGGGFSINSPSPPPDSINNCIYSNIAVIFDTDMDADGLGHSRNYELLECGQGDEPVCLGAPLPGLWKVLDDFNPNRGLYFGLENEPDHILEKNTWYRFTIRKVNSTDPTQSLKSIAGLVPLKEDYTWDFKTADSEVCPVEEIGVTSLDLVDPNLIVGATNQEDFKATLYPLYCNYVLPDNFNYNIAWATDPLDPALNPGDVAEVDFTEPAAVPLNQLLATATAVNGGITDIIARDTISFNSGSAELTVNACITDDRCRINWLTGARCAAAEGGCCSQSECDDEERICSPDIVDTEWNSGKDRTWTTVRGCWFGANPGHITYTDNVNVRDWVDPSVAREDCGDIWSNNQVIVEIPPGMGNGPKEGWLRADHATFSMSTVPGDNQAIFTVDDSKNRPGVCRLVPGAIEREQELTIIGKNFGGIIDKVYFRDQVDGLSRVEASDYISWENLEIKVVVLPAARTGDLEVYRAIFSNPIRLVVITELPEVQEVDGCDLESVKPSPNPLRNANNVCTNAVITGRFNMLEIDEASIILGGNITLRNLDTDFLVPALAGVRDFGDVKGFEIRPNLNLLPDTRYEVKVQNIFIEGHGDLKMITPYVWEFTTGDAPCPVDEILVSPTGGVARSPDGVVRIRVGGLQDYRVRGVSDECMELTDEVIANWSTGDEDIASVNPMFVGAGPLIGQETKAKGIRLGETEVTATLGLGPLSDSDLLRVVKTPRMVYQWPGNDDVDICRNTAPEVVYNQIMDKSTLNSDNISFVKGVLVGDAVNGKMITKNLDVIDLKCPSIKGCTSIMFVPDGLLDPLQKYTLNISGIKNIYGQIPADLSLIFTTGDINKICKVDRVEVSIIPNLGLVNKDMFLCAGRNDCPGDVSRGALSMDGNQHLYTALVYDNLDHPIVDAEIAWAPTAGSKIYDYTAGATSDLAYLTSKNEEGEDNIVVTASNNPLWKVDASSDTETVEITNWFCENPWPSLEDFPYEDFKNDAANCPVEPAGVSCFDFNFSTFYCRDSGKDEKKCVGGLEDGNSCVMGITSPCATEGGVCVDSDDLPVLSINPIVKKFDGTNQPAQTSDLLKEFIFSLDRNDDQGKDVIGLRIFNNTNHLSPASWYQEHGKAGTLKSAGYVDGYPAADEGRAIYIVASSDTGSELYTNTYLISYNQNARKETLTILDRLLNNWKFNTNVLANKEELVNDTNRMIHFSEMSKNLEEYKLSNDEYPELKAGSFIETYSVSKWPSWTKELGKEIKTSFVDPINTFAECVGHDPETCWNEDAGTFICPVGSHVYTYRNMDDTFELASDFEYNIRGGLSYGWNNFDVEHFRIVGICKGLPFGVSKLCGDRILSLTETDRPEECEIGYSKSFCAEEHPSVDIFYNDQTVGCVPPGDLALECSWEVFPAFSCEYCGDSAYQSAFEQCDSGLPDINLGANSLYNQYLCGSDCDWNAGGWCGDGITQDVNCSVAGPTNQAECAAAAGVWLETCDGVPSVINCTLVGGHDGTQTASCNSDCKGYGTYSDCLSATYCGDEIENGRDETCDEGVDNGVGACRDDCTMCGDDKKQEGHGEVCDGIDDVIPVNAVCESDCSGWSCAAGYRPYDGGCELDHCVGLATEDCPVTNGTGEKTRVCDLTAHPPVWGAFGACAYSCTEDFEDCNDDMATDGCEIETGVDLNNCGICGTVCPVPANASATCVDGACGLMCDANYDDCDSDAENGCELDVRSDLNNCGSCGNVCPLPWNATPDCTTGSCGFTCNANFDDCDNNPANGCEADLDTNLSHCGACNNTCSAPDHGSTPLCNIGLCEFTCDAGYLGWGSVCCIDHRDFPAYPHYAQLGASGGDGEAPERCIERGYDRVCTKDEMFAALEGYGGRAMPGWVDDGVFGNCVDWTDATDLIEKGTLVQIRAGTCSPMEREFTCDNAWAQFVWCCNN